MPKTRPALLVALVGLALLLAACQDPPPTFTFAGVTTTDGTEHPLTLTYQERGERLIGEYRVGAIPGRFTGTRTENTITADLIPAPDCAYTFEGTLTDTTLTGAFAPTHCPGGQPGTWTLELQ